MKISASIYSNPSNDLLSTINELMAHNVDILHVDCNDDPAVFDDIKKIRKLTNLPIDLHLITSKPERYSGLLEQNPVEYLTLQHENLKNAEMPKKGFEHLGIAFTSETEIPVFEKYSNQCDFFLMMATIPGKSGGKFNTDTFRRIREFKRLFSGKPLHVDGGVNDEVSFILRNLGVRCAVSGSYIYKEETIGGALVKLKSGETDSHFLVADFMRRNEEVPAIKISELNLETVLRSIEKHHLGFTTVVDDNENLKGIISNADVRQTLLKNVHDLNSLDSNEMINRHPTVANEQMTVRDLLKFIREQSFPINFLPVTNNSGQLVGALSFNELIKGES